jgi:hypothetical protein
MALLGEEFSDFQLCYGPSFRVKHATQQPQHTPQAESFTRYATIILT